VCVCVRERETLMGVFSSSRDVKTD
jgi:hypothetical protein